MPVVYFAYIIFSTQSGVSPSFLQVTYHFIPYRKATEFTMLQTEIILFDLQIGNSKSYSNMILVYKNWITML